MIKLSSNEALFKVLDELANTEAYFIILPANSFPIEKQLNSFDCEYTCYHKGPEPPLAVDNVSDLIQYKTSKTPVYKDWYLSVTYHS